jgi:hypothetical protein
MAYNNWCLTSEKWQERYARCQFKKYQYTIHPWVVYQVPSYQKFTTYQCFSLQFHVVANLTTIHKRI